MRLVLTNNQCVIPYIIMLTSLAVNKWSCLRFPTVLISQLEEERASCLQSRMMRQCLDLRPLIPLYGITHVHIVLHVPDV